MHAQNPIRISSRNSLVTLRATLIAAAAAFTFSALGQLTRQPNTTMDFPDTAPPSGYVLTNLLPGIALHRPVAVKTPPGETNRLFIVERNGRIIVINDLVNPTGQVFLDIRSQVHAGNWSAAIEDRRTEGLSSLAFHPEFSSNGRFFVTYNTVTNTSQGEGHHNRISEFRVSTNSAVADTASEIPLITQFDEGAGHNFNDLHFGPDGYLYVALGDEGDGGSGDDYNNAQKIEKDFFSGIIRIDVDGRPENLAPNPHPASSGKYRVPVDNPFVGATSFLGQPLDTNKVRTEFYAVGLRNVWRISFDPITGQLYAGDVGQHDREEINRIVIGGNYGWSFKQGSLTGPKGPPPAGFSFIDPIWEYGPGFGPEQGRSVTGGVVYRGSRLASLRGHLIFADFESGNIWAMNIDRDPVGRPERLAGQPFIAGFGYDPRNGDILIVNHGHVSEQNAGQILRLSVAESNVRYPAKLSDTGIFRNLTSLRTEQGIYPFEINLPFWSDGAIKSRWFSIPEVAQKIQFNAEQNWVFPPGTTWIKHFELETTPGDPNTRTRVETRVLVKTEGGGYGLTYKWNDAGTEASLVGELGEDQEFKISQGGVISTQVWHFPSRQECLACHNNSAGFALGFNTAQLNRAVTHGTNHANQIAQLADAGFLSNPPLGVHGLRALAAPDDTSASLTYRVKSYLAANCGYCHQPGGSAAVNALWDGRITTPFSTAGILYGALYDNAIPGEKVVTPGRPDQSGIVRRITITNHRDRMPPIGSVVVDQKAVDLLTEWITQETPRFEGYNQWAARMFDATIERTNILMNADPDGDGVSNYGEYLVGSQPLNAASKLPVSILLTNGYAAVHFSHPANRAVLLESAPAADSTNWTAVQSVENQMTFPAQPEPRQVRDSVNRPQQIYRARVIEP